MSRLYDAGDAEADGEENETDGVVYRDDEEQELCQRTFRLILLYDRREPSRQR